MTAISFGGNLSEEDEFSFPALDPGALFCVTLIWGGVGTVTLGYVNANGAFSAIQNAAGVDIALTTDTTASYELRIPHTGVLAAKVESGSPTVGSLNAVRCLP